MQGQSLLEAIGISTTKSSLEARDNGVCATTSQEPSSPRLYTNVNVDPSVDRLYRHARKHLKRGDEAKAAELLAEAAEQGHAAAHFQLGLLFEEGATFCTHRVLSDLATSSDITSTRDCKT
jgi:hypothetical protein